MQSTSGPASPRAAMVMTAVAVVLALIGVIAIASGATDKDDDDKVASTRSSTTSTTDTTLATGTTVTALGATTTTAKAGTTGTTVKGGTTPTTVTADCPNPPAASADPGPVQPPAIGDYTYASCSKSSDTLTTTIGAGASGNGVTRRTQSGGQSGFNQTSNIAYGPNGVITESLKAKSPQGDYTCDWNPDVVNYPPAMSVGSQWNTNSSCDLKDSKGASPGKLKLELTGKVTGKVAYNVGGTTVNAWVVEQTIKFTITTALGTQATNGTSKFYYDPAHGIEVYRHVETTGEGATTRDDRLVSLTPKTS